MYLKRHLSRWIINFEKYEPIGKSQHLGAVQKFTKRNQLISLYLGKLLSMHSAPHRTPL
jgi:hypothetical protein